MASTDRVIRDSQSAIGADVVTTKYGTNIVFRNYLVDRPAHTQKLRAAEAVLDITIVVAKPVRRVWPVFANFNLWMNRFGYIWDEVPAEKENDFAYLGNVGTSNDLKYGTQGAKTKYVVRKVIKEQLIYFDSFPYRLRDRDVVFTGHNLMSMREANGQTEISIFMEHTWYSETATLEDLRAEARTVMFDDAVAFWRDYFIPDLISLIDVGDAASPV